MVQLGCFFSFEANSGVDKPVEALEFVYRWFSKMRPLLVGSFCQINIIRRQLFCPVLSRPVRIRLRLCSIGV